jgi:hypothetical protein
MALPHACVTGEAIDGPDPRHVREVRWVEAGVAVDAGEIGVRRGLEHGPVGVERDRASLSLGAERRLAVAGEAVLRGLSAKMGDAERQEGDGEDGAAAGATKRRRQDHFAAAL